MMLENDENFQYFFHGTNCDEAESFFKKGLIDYRGGMLGNTTHLYTKLNFGDSLEEAIKFYPEFSSYKNVVVVKIPFRIMGAINREGVPYIPVPIWKNDASVGYHGRATALTPELVAGMYYSEGDRFVENPNYSTSFNPNGLAYDESQIRFLRNEWIQDWLEFAEARREKSYEELLAEDKRNRPFDELMEFYVEKGILQKKPTVISSKRFLEWGIERGKKIGNGRFKEALRRAGQFIGQIFGREAADDDEQEQ